MTEALERIRSSHPERAAVTQQDLKLADTQLVIARELGLGSWAKLKEYLLFRQAVQWLDTGQTANLDTLLQKYPAILRYRCRRGEWYEQGYFQGATLLSHIAGNPIRRRHDSNRTDIPGNAAGLGKARRASGNCGDARGLGRVHRYIKRPSFRRGVFLNPAIS